MAATLSTLIDYIESRDLKYQICPYESLVSIGFKTSTYEHILVYVELTENGHFLRLVAPDLVHVTNHPYRPVILQCLLDISYSTKLIKFGYAPDEGEVNASVELYLGNTPLSQQQFDRLLDGLMSVLEGEVLPRLKTILVTGRDAQFKVLQDEYDTLAQSMFENL